jgi:hypothetical protein
MREKERKGARLNFCYACRMLRRTRIHIDGLPLHIVQRGHNRGFFRKSCGQEYSCLRRGVRSSGTRC